MPAPFLSNAFWPVFTPGDRLPEGNSREEIDTLAYVSTRQALRFMHAFSLSRIHVPITGRSRGRRGILPREEITEKIEPVIEAPLAGPTDTLGRHEARPKPEAPLIEL